MPSKLPNPPESITVSAVMPCLNEAKTLPICIEKIKQAFSALGITGEIIVADNGSTDGSRELAENLGARVVLEQRRGYGSALMTGIRHARGQVIVMADADDSYDWSSLGDFVKKVDEGYDFVIGNRFRGGIEPGAMPHLHRYFGNPFLSWATRILYGIPLGDFHCGMRAFTKEAFRRMNVRTTGMEFATEMVVCSAQAGMRIGEIPTRLYPDKRDRAPHLRSFRDGWRHLRFMITYAPDALYLIPGLIMLVAGLVGVALLSGGSIALGGFHMGIHYLALASLMALLGANVTGFGVLAKAINSDQCPIDPNSLIGKLISGFTLEIGLVAGATIFLGGLIPNLFILHEWLTVEFGGMESTVHLAFTAATLMILGVNVAFGSFLLYMVKER